MKWLSLNCQGLASPAKKVTFRRLMDSKRVDVNFLQDTLGLIGHIIPALESLVPD